MVTIILFYCCIVHLFTEPDKPMDVTVSALPVENGENVALNVNWNPPVIPNGKIDHYNVYYRKKPWLTDLIYRKDFCQDSTCRF